LHLGNVGIDLGLVPADGAIGEPVTAGPLPFSLKSVDGRPAQAGAEADFADPERLPGRRRRGRLAIPADFLAELGHLATECGELFHVRRQEVVQEDADLLLGHHLLLFSCRRNRAAAAIVFEQSKLLEPRADAAPADVQVAGEGGDAWRLASPASGPEMQAPGGDDVGVGEGTGWPAAAAEASSCGKVAGSGLVVQLAGVSESAEVLADGGIGDAELAGELALRERTAATPTLPPGQQLKGVEGGRGAAPAGAGGACGGSG
jgi:hypothetical protein